MYESFTRARLHAHRAPRGGTAAYGYVQTGSDTGYALGAILEGGGQAALDSDFDGDQAITINGAATNCNANAGADDEVVYCVRP